MVCRQIKEHVSDSAFTTDKYTSLWIIVGPFYGPPLNLPEHEVPALVPHGTPEFVGRFSGGGSEIVRILGGFPFPNLPSETK